MVGLAHRVPGGAVVPRQITVPKVSAETASAAHPDAKREEIRRKIALATRHVGKVALSDEDCARLLDMLGLGGDGPGHTTSPLTSEWANAWQSAT